MIEIFATQILPAVAQVQAQCLTGFLPMKGQQYEDTRSLMIVGRAVNGWTEHITSDDLNDENQCWAYARLVLESVTQNMEGGCPMSWVIHHWGMAAAEGYNTRRSAFWRAVRRLVGNLQIADVEGEWPSHLVWSNLYKVSPAAGGNPGTMLQRAQFNGCMQLLRWEIENYRPQRLLFLTGYDWVDPFLQQAWRDCERPNDQLVQAVGRVTCGDHDAACVVACHPQSRNEQNWVNAVVEAFNGRQE
jgi:hypothetical protein